MDLWQHLSGPRAHEQCPARSQLGTRVTRRGDGSTIQLLGHLLSGTRDVVLAYDEDRMLRRYRQAGVSVPPPSSVQVAPSSAAFASSAAS